MQKRMDLCKDDLTTQDFNNPNKDEENNKNKIVEESPEGQYIRVTRLGFSPISLVLNVYYS